ncbi:zinc ribbon domain-containing protein [Paenibacillus rhizoplanae]
MKHMSAVKRIHRGKRAVKNPLMTGNSCYTIMNLSVQGEEDLLMTYCTACGAEYKQGAKFCGECGAGTEEAGSPAAARRPAAGHSSGPEKELWQGQACRHLRPSQGADRAEYHQVYDYVPADYGEERTDRQGCRRNRAAAGQ